MRSVESVSGELLEIPPTDRPHAHPTWSSRLAALAPPASTQCHTHMLDNDRALESSQNGVRRGACARSKPDGRQVWHSSTSWGTHGGCILLRSCDPRRRCLRPSVTAEAGSTKILLPNQEHRSAPRPVRHHQQHPFLASFCTVTWTLSEPLAAATCSLFAFLR
uniref:Uncharacterized protein n=1 Tax=Haptolina brevifila TaxID=156173 RepID=A0A7S2BSM7_9EUKA